MKALLECATSLASFTNVLLQDWKALRALKNKGASFHWEEEEEDEFSRIIKRLTDQTILRQYDTSQSLAIEVDTSVQVVSYTDKSKGQPNPNNAKTPCSRPLCKCADFGAVEPSNLGDFGSNFNGGKILPASLLLSPRLIFSSK